MFFTQPRSKPNGRDTHKLSSSFPVHASKYLAALYRHQVKAHKSMKSVVVIQCSLPITHKRCHHKLIDHNLNLY
jgi:hypothetical protein